MLRIDNLSYRLGGRVLFDNASLRCPKAVKVGLVGANGVGKTTLFRLITGQIIPTEGTITIPKQTRLGWLEQHPIANPNCLVLDSVLAADQERANLLQAAEQTNAADEIAAIHTRLADIDAWSAEARAVAVLTGLGFTAEQHHQRLDDFSGGWQMRVRLAGLLFSAPDLLLLDEPSNYLDLEGTLWLQDYLSALPATVVLISHDRALLNGVVDAIAHLEQRKLTLWQGNFDGFLRQSNEHKVHQIALAKKQTEQRARLQRFVDRFRAQPTKARQAQSRLKVLAKMVDIAPPIDQRGIEFRFPMPQPVASPLLELTRATLGYRDPAQPEATPTVVLRRLDVQINAADRIAVLGVNGSGKTTLTKCLAGTLSLLSGTRQQSAKATIGYFTQNQTDALEQTESPLTHVQRMNPDVLETKQRARLAGFGFDAETMATKVAHLSGGQQARLALLLATYHAPHILILDEPTNHLDMLSREALAMALLDYQGAVILISHDFHLLNMVCDRVWLVGDGSVVRYQGDLTDYRHAVLNTPALPHQHKRNASKAAKTKHTSHPQNTPVHPDVYQQKAEKLVALLEKIDHYLSDPTLYQSGSATTDTERTKWQSQRERVARELKRVEDLWLEALEQIEQTEQTEQTNNQ